MTILLDQSELDACAIGTNGASQSELAKVVAPRAKGEKKEVLLTSRKCYCCGEPNH